MTPQTHKIQIAGKKVTIIVEAILKDGDGSKVWGNFDVDTHDLKLCTSLKKLDTVNTLAHELVHAAIHLYHFPGLSDEEEESLASIIGEAIAAGFKPWLKELK